MHQDKFPRDLIFVDEQVNCVKKFLRFIGELIKD